MKSTTVLASLTLLFSRAQAACADDLDPACYDAADVVTKDVAVIGGGSSGTYAAVTLRDMGKTVFVVEKKPVLGGHTETYTVPGSGTKIDVGVQVYWNTSIVTDFFSRLQTPIAAFAPPPSGGPPAFVDMSTGEVLADFAPAADFAPYEAEVDKYPYLTWGFDLPQNVPDDLLLPFSKFLKKYSLEDSAFSFFTQSATGGLGNLLHRSVLSVMKAFGSVVFQEGQGELVVTAAHNNHLLYENALAELGDDVLLNSTVIKASRPPSSTAGGDEVHLVVATPTGNKLVMVSQVLFTAPQTLQNLSPLDLDAREHHVFGKLEFTGYYCGLINNTGLSAGQKYINAGADTKYNIPSLPALYHVFPTAVEGIYSFWYGSETPIDECRVKKDILRAVKLMSNSAADPEFLAFANHSPFHPHVSAKNVNAGFYSNLNSLQGYRNTWYTGNLFEPAAGPLWVFTASLMDKLAASAV